jgi:hypothetical protein
MPLPKAQSLCDPWPIKKNGQRKEISPFKKERVDFIRDLQGKMLMPQGGGTKQCHNTYRYVHLKKSEGNLIFKLKYFGLERRGMLPGHQCVSTLQDDMNGAYHGGASKVFITTTMPNWMPSTSFFYGLSGYVH